MPSEIFEQTGRDEKISGSETPGTPKTPEEEKAGEKSPEEKPKEKKERPKLKIICAWCKKDMGEREGTKEGVSHGICPECAEKQRAEIKEMKEKIERERRG